MILHGHWKSRDQLNGSSLPPKKTTFPKFGDGRKLGGNRGGKPGEIWKTVLLLFVVVCCCLLLFVVCCLLLLLLLLWLLFVTKKHSLLGGVFFVHWSVARVVSSSGMSTGHRVQWKLTVRLLNKNDGTGNRRSFPWTNWSLQANKVLHFRVFFFWGGGGSSLECLPGVICYHPLF